METIYKFNISYVNIITKNTRKVQPDASFDVQVANFQVIFYILRNVSQELSVICHLRFSHHTSRVLQNAT